MALIDDAIAACAGFQRCKGYPRDERGIIALGEGLIRASRMTGVAMQTIVRDCLEISTHCPTDADLLAVARDIRGPEPAPELPPAPTPEQYSAMWAGLQPYLMQVRPNAERWQREFRAICKDVRDKMGVGVWMRSSGPERIRVAVELGYAIQVPIPPGHRLEDMGLGAFVRRDR